MASLRDLRRRIRSLVSIKQITRAMEMVATTKLRRVQGRAIASRPFTNEIETIVRRFAATVPPGASPLLENPDAKAAATRTVGLVIVTSDRGLCGAYNANVLGEFHRWIDENPGAKPRLYVFGKKGYVYLFRRGYEVVHYFSDPPLEKLDFWSARIAARTVADEFLKGVVSEVHVISTRFDSMVTFRPAVTRWLPVSPGKAAPEEAVDAAAIVEPSRPFLLDRLVPKYLAIKIWNLLLESLTSEYASRRVSMKNATDAAEEMRGTLLRTYNRARQESITKQLLEIVGGAEALR
ncbi:MAG TPA: ATP synthase F1 subunit gamma [Planctomycetota bacterium]|nr:ATP synthase F1 subunit gamma [Planctomycetota bacterium]